MSFDDIGALDAVKDTLHEVGTGSRAGRLLQWMLQLMLRSVGTSGRLHRPCLTPCCTHTAAASPLPGAVLHTPHRCVAPA